MHIKGYGAPETKAAAEHARLLIEQAEALGEPPEDSLLLFLVLVAFLPCPAVVRRSPRPASVIMIMIMIFSSGRAPRVDRECL
jgi:hypothetical protein